MPSRVMRLVAAPASIALLGCIALGSTRRPGLLPALTARKPEAARSSAAEAKKPLRALPRIVAVDRHVAKRIDDLRPSVKLKLMKVAARLPKRVTLLVTSAARTHAEQAALHSTFGVKAKPGRSCHEDGRAVDVNVLVDGTRARVRTQNRIIGYAMKMAGFHYLGAMDPVHYSVPMEGISDKATAPDLAVMTWNELNELKAEIAEKKLSGEQLADAQPVAPVGTLVAGIPAAL